MDSLGRAGYGWFFLGDGWLWESWVAVADLSDRPPWKSWWWLMILLGDGRLWEINRLGRAEAFLGLLISRRGVTRGKLGLHQRRRLVQLADKLGSL